MNQRTSNSQESDVSQARTNLCRHCAEWAFTRWKGWCSSGTESWRDKPNLPDVPSVDTGPCLRCGGIDKLNPRDVYYRNYHGPYNTGLPDYFELITQARDEFNMRRWGAPFIDAWVVKRIPLDQLEAHVAQRHDR